jgi:hypothetical protein
MSPLPQKKKSAEEIAKLREDMGLPPGTVETTPEPEPAPAPIAEPEPPRPRAEPKPVRSLRRSERQAPAEPHISSTESWASSLPAQRRSENELEKIRQREAMQALVTDVPPAVAQLQAITAHPVVLALGYVLVVGGAIGFIAVEDYARIKPEFYAFGGSVAGLLVALFIALKKVRSRHHAGFIAMIALVVLVFTVFHHFNNFNPTHAS